MQISQGLSIKNTLALFAGIVAAIFIVVGVIAYYAVDSFQGTLEKSTSNATLLRATGGGPTPEAGSRLRSGSLRMFASGPYGDPNPRV